MANMGDTGNGATFTLATQSLSLAIDSIEIGEITVEMYDVSTLSTSAFMEYIAAALKDTPELTVGYVFSTTLDEVSAGAVPETGTVTWPQRTGETGAATLAGTGVVTGHTLPSLQNGEVQKGQLRFRYDGDTGPTYTKATTV